MRTVKINWNSDYNVDSFIDKLNDKASGLNLMSIALAFTNRPSLCIRMYRGHDDWITGSTILRTAVENWITNGSGVGLAHFRGRTGQQRRLRREMYPAKLEWVGNPDSYVYYLGRYGDGDLWSIVNNARRANNSVPEAVALTYEHRSQSNFDEAVSFGPEEEEQFRSYRILGWCDGEIIMDNYSVGTDASNWGSTTEALPNDCVVEEWGI